MVLYVIDTTSGKALTMILFLNRLIQSNILYIIHLREKW